MLVTFGSRSMQIAMAEAKARFAELIRRAEAGEAVTLTRHGRPVARIVAPDRRAGSSRWSAPWAGR
jgi:prevent-host-death family protein